METFSLEKFGTEIVIRHNLDKIYRIFLLKIIIQLTLVISTSLISNNRLSPSENLIPALDEKLITGNKILWKRGEIAPKEQFLLISTIFSIYL